MIGSLSSRFGITAAGLSVVALVAAGCGTDAGPATSASASEEPAAAGAGGQISVVASTDVYGSIAAAVGGERVDVTSIIDDPNADPLEYEATPADAAAVAEAQVVIMNGNGYDEFMSQLVEAAGNVETVLDVSQLSGLQPADGEGEFNEHVWYSLDTVRALAETLAADLGEASPEDADTFAGNAEEFSGQVDALKEQVADISSASQGARVAVTEPLANYLLDEAGVENPTPEEFQEAIEEGNDPSAAVLQEMLALFGDDPVQALILNTQTQSAVTDQVREAAEAAEVAVVEMSETLTTPDYVDWMGGQIQALAAALEAGN